jgi:hypothetical protein
MRRNVTGRPHRRPIAIFLATKPPLAALTWACRAVGQQAFKAVRSRSLEKIAGLAVTLTDVASYAGFPYASDDVHATAARLLPVARALRRTIGYSPSGCALPIGTEAKSSLVAGSLGPNYRTAAP